MILPANEIAAAIGIHTTDTTPISTLLTDSRDLAFPQESIFIALQTPVNDGHKFVSELYGKGVRHFIVGNDYKAEAMADAQIWHVADTLAALQQIAESVRVRFPNLPVIGITGSRGKTVAKELIYRLLRCEFTITRSPRSYNSQIGVPLSVWSLTPATTLGIFEAGISKPGEMAKLQQIIQPTVGVFVSLTSEHDDGFPGGLEQKAQEKALLFTGCSDVFYPAGDPLISKTLSTCRANLHPIYGNVEDLAVAVAEHMLGKKVDHASISGLASRITPRIEVYETLKDCIIINDTFSTGVSSLAEALNYARKHTPIDKKLTLVTSNEIDDAALHRLAHAKGVSRIIKVDTADEFINKYSISDFNNEAILISASSESGFDDIRIHLEAPRHETVLEVDLGAITNNFNYFRSKLKPTTGLIAMVKAQGYGIGALELSKTLQSQGASYLAVAVIDEGAELRRGGVTMPIIVMNPISTNYKALFDNNLEPSVFSLRELLLLIENAKRLGIKDYPVHIKIDTGMHRVGFLAEEIPALLEVLKAQDNVKVSTIFSHLATADCLDQNEYTESQLKAFKEMSESIMDGLSYPVKRHVLNTAGILRYPEHQYDFARLGIGLYGISPLGDRNKDLQPVATLATRIISLKHWEPDATIGYGRKGVVTKPSEIATIPIGYADGLNRHLSNGKASVIVNGVACPIIGNICMDQCMVDVTAANAKIGDMVEIFGKRQPVEDIAAVLETIPYEVLTSVSPRVKRIYFRE